jgi:BMFP domain-containing protein YqiC
MAHLVVFILFGVIAMCFTAYKIAELFVTGSKSRDEMLKIQSQNEELKQRIENLETIITGIDTDLLDGMIKINSLSEAQKNKKQISDWAAKINDKSSDSLEKNVQSVLNKFLKKIDSLLDEPDKKKP